MVTTDQEIEATLERIRRFQAQVAQLRKVETNTVNYRLSALGFLAEIDRMQLEVREYLALHPTEHGFSAANGSSRRRPPGRRRSRRPARAR